MERSRLYSTTANQARMLQQRAQQLTDILNLGILSAADVPIHSLMPRIAEGIALWMIGSTLREVDGDHDLLRAAGYLKVALVGVEKMPGP